MLKSLEQLIDETPDEIVQEAMIKAEKTALEIKLSQLRERVEKTQVELADALGIKQPSLAAMEKNGKDIKLSSLKRYVEATGCKLTLDIELPDGSHMEMTV